MYRILILVAGFLIAVSGLLFLQGGERDPRDLAAVSPQLGDVALDDVRDMSAPSTAPAATSGELDLSALSAAVDTSINPAPAPDAGNELAAMTSGVLAGLGMEEGGATNGQADPMQDITAAVLASLNGGAAPNAAPASGQMDLKALIAQSMQSGQGDAYIDALLNEAVTTGQVQVPEAMLTADGRLDTRTFLASIVQKSMGNAQDPMVQAISAEAGAGTAVQAQTTSGKRYYTVESGDSLAYISLLFYQDTGQYTRIFEANRDKIASPNQIRVGQRLLIPG